MDEGELNGEVNKKSYGIKGERKEETKDGINWRLGIKGKKEI